MELAEKFRLSTMAPRASSALTVPACFPEPPLTLPTAQDPILAPGLSVLPPVTLQECLVLVVSPAVLAHKLDFL